MFCPDAFDLPKNETNICRSNKNAFEYLVPTKSRSGFSFLKTGNYLGIVHIIPKKVRQPYAELPGSSVEDQRKIIELFSTMGSHNKLVLLMKYKSHLEKLGDEIKSVHPLRLLGVIFSHPNMKPCMDDIFNDHFKWKHFIGGFAPNMDRELSQSNLIEHIDDFAKDVNVSPQNIRPFFDKKDWTGLIKYLIYN